MRLAYEVSGEGPALVAVMGFTAGRFQWMGFPERLAAGRRLLLLDNRGVGASDAPPGPYSVAQMADDTVAVMDAAGIERATVLGVSMGGMIAQELALRAPGRVERLVLGCTHHGGPRHVPPSDTALSTLAPRPGRSGIDTLRALLELNFSEAFLARRPEVLDELIDYGMRHKMVQAGFLGQLAALGTHDTEARLGRIACPTLVLTGDADRLVAPGNSALLAAKIPGAVAHVLPGVGHMFWVEAASEAAAIVQAFLAT